VWWGLPFRFAMTFFWLSRFVSNSSGVLRTDVGEAQLLELDHKLRNNTAAASFAPNISARTMMRTPFNLSPTRSLSAVFIVGMMSK
jgi:hypothetical protein